MITPLKLSELMSDVTLNTLTLFLRPATGPKENALSLTTANETLKRICKLRTVELRGTWPSQFKNTSKPKAGKPKLDLYLAAETPSLYKTATPLETPTRYHLFFANKVFAVQGDVVGILRAIELPTGAPIDIKG